MEDMQKMFEDDASNTPVLDNELATISALADQMCKLLGPVDKMPSMSADLSAFTKWARDKKLTELPIIPKMERLSIAELAGALALRIKEYRRISTDVLPAAMLEVGGVGIRKFTLGNGYQIEIEDEMRAALRADQKEPAFDWLKEHGLGDIIKDDVEVMFGRGDELKVKNLLAYCVEQGYIAKENKNVNAATLKATIKEQMKKGVLFPTELFVIHEEHKAVIKTK